MRNKYILIGIVVGVLLSSVAVVLAGQIDSPAGPTAAGGQMHTLEQIYDRLNAGTAATKMTTFTEPGSGPGSTMHTLDEVMAKAPARDNTNGATTAQVLSGKTFWGLRTSGGTWGTQTGSMPVRGGYTASTDQSYAGGKVYFKAPEGYYDGDDWVWATHAEVRALDADITVGNIKSGVTIFGLTGQLYGGCTCTGTLNGTRWCDNGDGTVTDLTTCLVWLKKADWGGLKQWRQPGDYDQNDDAHTRAGLLKAGAAGADLSDGSVVGDWRMPTKAELDWLANGPEGVSSGEMRAFTGVQAGGMLGEGYWSSTTTADDVSSAWWVRLEEGEAHGQWIPNTKFFLFYVWPVRGGQ